MRVDIAVFDGVDDLDAVGPYSVLSMAARAGLGVTVRLTTAGDLPPSDLAGRATAVPRRLGAVLTTNTDKGNAR